MAFGSLVGWTRATELNVSATSDTVLSEKNEVVDVLSRKAMVGCILAIPRWPDDEQFVVAAHWVSLLGVWVGFDI